MNIIMMHNPIAAFGEQKELHKNLQSAHNRALHEIYEYANRYRKRYGEVDWLYEVSEFVKKNDINGAIKHFNTLHVFAGSFHFKEMEVLDLKTPYGR